MRERDVVWEHGENLFLRFKCKYCVKEFCVSGGTRLKEYLAEKSGNVARYSKHVYNIRQSIVE
jgi:transposase-like protein